MWLCLYVWGVFVFGLRTQLEALSVVSTFFYLNLLILFVLKRPLRHFLLPFLPISSPQRWAGCKDRATMAAKIVKTIASFRLSTAFFPEPRKPSTFDLNLYTLANLLPWPECGSSFVTLVAHSHPSENGSLLAITFFFLLDRNSCGFPLQPCEVYPPPPTTPGAGNSLLGCSSSFWPNTQLWEVSLNFCTSRRLPPKRPKPKQKKKTKTNKLNKKPPKTLARGQLEDVRFREEFVSGGA